MNLDILTGTKVDAEIFIKTANRKTLICLLSANDRNGIYSDSDSIKQFGSVSTLSELKEAFWNQFDGQD
jgi:hypothetical protein